MNGVADGSCSGADSAITQFFFEPEIFLRYRDAAADAGIDKPIVPGVMLQPNFKGLQKMAGLCGAFVPLKISQAYEGLDDDAPARDRATIRRLGLVGPVRHRGPRELPRDLMAFLFNTVFWFYPLYLRVLTVRDEISDLLVAVIEVALRLHLVLRIGRLQRVPEVGRLGERAGRQSQGLDLLLEDRDAPLEVNLGGPPRRRQSPREGLALHDVLQQPGEVAAAAVL
mgnify:CR=1 FL=1